MTTTKYRLSKKVKGVWHVVDSFDKPEDAQAAALNVKGEDIEEVKVAPYYLVPKTGEE